MSLASPAAPRQTGLLPWLMRGLVGLVFVGLLAISWSVYLVGQALFGACVLLVALGFLFLFGFRRFYFARFIFPGISTMLLFVLFPIFYTIYLGFTNYGSFNLLSFERVTEVLLSAKAVAPETERPFGLVAEEGQYRVFLPEESGGLLSEPLALQGAPEQVLAQRVTEAPEALLSFREVVKLRKALAEASVVLPDQTELRASGLRTFASVQPEYQLQEDGTLLSLSGARLTPDPSTGFYRTADGEKVTPGWRTFIGLENFLRIFQSEGIRAPLVQIFTWTLVFATASVLLTFGLGLGLALILQWPHLRFKTAYRVLLILPYAVPAFISILVFRGLFNQNFGEINLILEALFQLRPAWFTNETLARSMILMVNTWLGYPYMMLLAMGFLQSIPQDHYKAAALEGAGTFRVFFSITLPQILPPFLPLLLASFAFNFNNIVLILLLTRGLPDIPGTVIPAGETDILGSFTYRIAFMDSGTQFGLAGAITLLIFIIVSLIAYANFVAMRRATSAGAP